jgi:hypothetical protein
MSYLRYAHEDPLGLARGAIIGLPLAAVLWVLGLGGFWVLVKWFA